MSKRKDRASEQRTSTKEGVAIGASHGVYGLFAAYNYTAWHALADFIDNSVSSWLGLRIRARRNENLRIDIDWDPDFGTGLGAGKLVIEDNAGGISTKDLAQAFKLATPPADMTRLNQFWVGLKVATPWFAKTLGASSVDAGVRGELHNGKHDPPSKKEPVRIYISDMKKRWRGGYQTKDEIAVELKKSILDSLEKAIGSLGYSIRYIQAGNSN